MRTDLRDRIGWIPNMRPEREAAEARGLIAGLVALLLVLLPAAACGAYGALLLFGVPVVEGQASDRAGIAWLLGAAVLLVVPVWVGLAACNRRPALPRNRGGWAD